MEPTLLWKLAGFARGVRCRLLDTGNGRLALVVERGDSALVAEIYRDANAARARARWRSARL